jgi:hypothetical protein
MAPTAFCDAPLVFTVDGAVEVPVPPAAEETRDDTDDTTDEAADVTDEARLEAELATEDATELATDEAEVATETAELEPEPPVAILQIAVVMFCVSGGLLVVSRDVM